MSDHDQVGPDVDSATTTSTAAVPTCPGCGARRETGWQFCEICGHTLDALPAPYAATGPLAAAEETSWSDAVVPGTSFEVPSVPAFVEEEKRRGGARRVVAVVAVAVLLLVVAAVGGLGWVKASHAQGRLEATQARLSKSQATLAFAQDTVDKTRDELTATNQTLDDTKSQLDEAYAKVDKTRGSLSSAQDRLDLQAGQITSLKTCLQGVSTALSDVAYNDYDAAIAALDRVEADCQRSKSIL